MTVQTHSTVAPRKTPASLPPQGGPAAQGQRLPPLNAGDQLTRAEFERRYLAHPNIKKAELIEGVVYMPSPTRLTQHGQPHSDIVTWLGAYRAATAEVRAANNTTVRLDNENEVQPDALLYRTRGGQPRYRKMITSQGRRS